MSLKVVIELEKVFKSRQAEYIDAPKPISIIETERARYVQIYDTNLTREILDSKNLEAFNYYSEGIERLKKTGNKIDILDHFWRESLLFINGTQHKENKLLLQKEIINIEKTFVANQDSYSQIIQEQIIDCKCPIEYSKKITNTIVALIIRDLTSAPFEDCLALLQKRQGVFFNYFHTEKQKQLGHNLEDFFSRHKLKQINKIKQLLICTLLIMGADPIIGIIAGHLIKKNDHIKQTLQDIPAVSFITRINKKEFTLLGEAFFPGDIFNLTLVPSHEQYISNNYIPISFGFGQHKCLGIQLTNLIVNLAIDKSDIFQFEQAPINYRTSSEGSFLIFKLLK